MPSSGLRPSGGGSSDGSQAGGLVSAALVLPTGRPGEPLREVVALIDRIHTDGALPSIRVNRRPIRPYEGLYDPRPPYKITVSTHARYPRLTMVHETGHLLDHLGLGTPGTFASGDVNEPWLQPWRDAVAASAAYQELQRLELRYAGTPFGPHVAYLLGYDEAWARSYAQLVATRSGDPTLLAELEARRTRVPGTTYLPRQWDDVDFAPIAEAIEALFKDLGWMR